MSPTSRDMSPTSRDAAMQRKRPDDLQHDGGGSGHVTEKSKKDLDAELDKALEDSFPSSDPPSPSQPTRTEPAGDPDSKP
jgi:hypothetical protein